MSDNKTVVHSQNLGVLGWLGLIFITLKLCGIIGWSWWLVLAPFWAGIALILAFLAIIPVIGLAIAGLVALIAWVITLVCSFGKRK